MFAAQNGTKPLGVGLSALRARLLALPTGRGTVSLRNRPGGGAKVIVRVPKFAPGVHVR